MLTRKHSKGETPPQLSPPFECLLFCRLAAANASLDDAGSQLSEIDAKWAKMESHAVKSVPIIRQFKPTAVQVREIPPDAVKFKYNFSTRTAAQ